MIKINFHDKPLKQKLSVIILLTSSILLLLSTSAIVTNDLLSYRRNLVTEVFTLADLIGINSSVALLYDDQATAEENLAGLRANPHITTAHIFSKKDENVFASYFRETSEPNAESSETDGKSKTVEGIDSFQTGATPASWSDNYFFHNHHLEVFKPIRFKNKVMGLVHIQSDLTALTERLWWTGGILLTVLFISLLLGLWIAGKLQKLVTTPIYHLLNIMDRVSTQNDYSLRAEKSGNDELGKLIDGFNQMLGQIQDYRDHLEDKVKQRTVELAKARDQALAANKAKSVFLANISHEIRTPLNAVLGYAQLLQRDTNLTDEQYDSLQIIETSGDHLLELINDILDMSKIEAGATELRNESFSLCQLIQDVGALFKGTCEQKQLIWHVDTDLPDADRVVSGDAGKLRQVLINLVGNAVKFTHAGEIVLK
jgi:signal transduction histidine kinase